MIYLDAAAARPPRAAARDALLEALVGRWSACPAARVERSRRRAATALGLRAERLLWTAGATHANAIALTSARGGSPRLVSQPTEHPSVLEPLRALARRGARVDWLPVDPDGRVDPDALRRALRQPATLVSIMAANHETGVVQPTAALGAACRAAGTTFHVDAAQAPDPAAVVAHADLVSLSAAKLGGPQGVGLLVAPDGAWRAREAVPGPGAAAALAAALEVALGSGARAHDELAASRDALQAALLAEVSGATVNGAGALRLASHLNLSFERISGEALVLELGLRGVAASSGAACASGSSGPSPVLLALGRTPEQATGSLRLTLAAPLSDEDHRRVVAAVGAAVARLRRLAGG